MFKKKEKSIKAIEFKNDPKLFLSLNPQEQQAISGGGRKGATGDCSPCFVKI